MTLFFLFLATVFLAYSNGANDNFKGVATLFGSDTTDYRKALGWATLTTFLGSVSSVFYLVFRYVRIRMGVTKEMCVCVGECVQMQDGCNLWNVCICSVCHAEASASFFALKSG